MVAVAPSLWLLEAPLRDYAWGSRTVIAQLQGRPAPTDRPEAEAWFGAHPAAPSIVDGPGGRRSLAELITDDPVGMLGADVAARFGGRLPFLVKLLAADAPLSIQAHPSAAEAAAGFAAEEAAGVPVDAPHRVYRDPWPKPEILCALTPVTALCGFREVAATVALLDHLAVAELAWLRDDLAARGEVALAAALARVLRDEREGVAATLPDLAAAARRVADAPGPWQVDARWLHDLADRYPEDPGLVVALLLRRVELAPGEAIHLPAGNLHAYLHGAGVEVMASSDNVVRGGLTGKHVDVDELLRVVDARVLPPPFVGPSRDDGEVVLATPTPHFRLSRVSTSARPVTLDPRGPQLLLAVGGDVTVSAGATTVEVAGGHAVFAPARTRDVTVEGDGAELFRITPGDPS